MNDTNKNISPNQALNSEDQIDIKEIWRIIRSYRISIAIISVVILLITFYVTMTTPPV